VFTLSFGLFLYVGHELARAGVLPGDALARTLNAAAAVKGRDPHLEAIGFVWPPFPTLFEVAILALLPIKALVRTGYAGVIVSAALMAATVSAVRSWLEDCGLGRVARIGLVIALVANPMILLYGSNGMSEAGMLCFLVLAARRLAKWFERGAVADLVVAGICLGMAYLTRYEAAASIVAVTAVVGLDVLRRTAGDFRRRRRTAITAATVIGLPAVFAALLWALLSWAVVGEPFAQFTSEYGNSALVQAAADRASDGAGLSLGGRLLLLGQQVAVFGGLAIVTAMVLYWWADRGGRRVAAAVATLGAPIAFHAVAALGGSTFGWGRFVISLVPLGVMLLGVLIADLSRRPGVSSAVVVAVGCVVALASSAAVLAVVRTGDLETRDDAWALSVLPPPYRTHVDEGLSIPMEEGRTIARDIERLAPGRGSVVVDSASAFPIVMAADDLRVFVIPPDRDFMQILADPYSFGVDYLLVSSPDTLAHDEVATVFPTLYENGAGISELVEEWNLETLRYRLYRVQRTVVR
jgi:hypothetical protein